MVKGFCLTFVCLIHFHWFQMEAHLQLLRLATCPVSRPKSGQSETITTPRTTFGNWDTSKTCPTENMFWQPNFSQVPGTPTRDNTVCQLVPTWDGTRIEYVRSFTCGSFLF